MFIVFGILAIIFAILNIYYSLKGRDSRMFMYISLSSLALTAVAFYHDSAVRVVNEDWSGLTDVVPFMSELLLYFSIAIIIMNSLSLYKFKK